MNNQEPNLKDVFRVETQSVVNLKGMELHIIFGRMSLNTVDYNDRKLKTPKGYQLTYLFKLILCHTYSGLWELSSSYLLRFL